MYHSIVRNNLLAVFHKLNAKDYDAIPPIFAPQAEHIFYGQHALGGHRHSSASISRWYQRLPAALPSVQFAVKHIAISGWPWNTTAAVEWEDRGTTLDGQPFQNQGVHFVTIKWGRVTSLRIYCDTQLLVAVLQRNVAAGALEAGAAPITD